MPEAAALNRALSDENTKEFYAVGAAANLNTYADLKIFRDVNSLTYPLATAGELGFRSSKFQSTFTFIGKDSKVIGVLDDTASSVQIGEMLKRTLCSFSGITARQTKSYLHLSDENTILNLQDIFVYENFTDYLFRTEIYGPTDIFSYEISDEEIFIRKGSAQGNSDLIIRAEVPGKDIWVTSKITVINNDADILESFEYTDISVSPIPWVSADNSPWSTEKGTGFSGSYSLRSGQIDHSQRSSISVSLSLYEQGTVTFAYKTSTYYSYYFDEIDGDFLNFYVDDVNLSMKEARELWGGGNGWRTVSFNVNPGYRTLKWEYLKNDWASLYDEAVWIDNVFLPGTIVIDKSEITGTSGDVNLSAFPNPFNPVTKISFDLEYDENIELTLFDSAGRLTDSIFKGVLRSGNHMIEYNGSALSTGIYYAVLQIGSVRRSIKLLLVK